jgi:ATP-binding cassette subfamily F protein 3
MSRAMEGKTPAAVRAQLGRFGFSGDKATTKVAKLSGGERARLALALITREAPHLIILDEPTNHLDVDAREALVQALNGYDGAVILISHDRHMVELTADRLVLVDDGKAIDYDGSIDDYIDFVLGRNQPRPEAKAKGHKASRNDNSRDEAKALKKKVAEAESATARIAAKCAEIDAALIDPSKAAPDLRTLNAGELARRRAALAQELEQAEAYWLEISEQLEELAA